MPKERINGRFLAEHLRRLVGALQLVDEPPPRGRAAARRRAAASRRTARATPASTGRTQRARRGNDRGGRALPSRQPSMPRTARLRPLLDERHPAGRPGDCRRRRAPGRLRGGSRPPREDRRPRGAAVASTRRPRQPPFAASDSPRARTADRWEVVQARRQGGRAGARTMEAGRTAWRHSGAAPGRSSRTVASASKRA